MAGRKLNARFVETVAIALDRQDFPDAAVGGLQLRVTKSGNKSWAFRYRRKSDGWLRRVTIGGYPAFSLEEARQIARDHLAAIGHGSDPAGEAKERRRAETFEQISAVWVERHGKPNKSPRALQDDLGMLARHVPPVIGPMKAVEVTKRDIIQLLDKVATRPDARSKGSAILRKMTHRPNRVFELVRSIFRWAVGRDHIKIDPTWGMKAPIRKEWPRERELSLDEIRKLWLALNQAPVARRSSKGVPRGSKVVVENGLPMTWATALTLKLALVTAQRIGEVAEIAISELDLNDTAPTWVIPGERTKNGQQNRVPLSPLAIRLIREAIELSPESGWLFPNPKGKGPIHPHAPTRALARARPVIGLEDFRIHDLRRTAATRMAEMGVAPHTISLILNHVSARSGTVTDKVYVQYSYDREKREALNAWGTRLERIISGDDAGNVATLKGLASGATL